MAITISGDNPNLTSPTITGAVVSAMASSVITSGTAVASTSGTSIDFTGIPSWVKKITVMFSGVSTNGTTNVQIQLGDAGGIETSGYLGTSTRVTDTSSARLALSAGVNIDSLSPSAAASVREGQCIFSLLNSATNLWTFNGMSSNTNINQATFFVGAKALSDVLTQVRITTVGGTETFDAGTINILFE